MIGRFLPFLLALGPLGCGRGSDGLDRAPASGTVTLDGELLPEGVITFFPIDAKGVPAGGNIEQGAFSIPRQQGPIVGRNRVEIRSVRKTGRKFKLDTPPESVAEPIVGLEVDERAETLPDRYHNRSSLEVPIRPRSNPDLLFELTSGSPGRRAE